MKKHIVLALAAIMTGGMLMAQQPAKTDKPETDPKQTPQVERFRPDGPHSHGAPAIKPDRDRRHKDDRDRRDDKHHKHGKERPDKPRELVYNADGIETTIVLAFPQAKSVKKQAKWTEVYDGKAKLIGYAVYSKPASDKITGYAGETPVLIALNKKKVILGVYALPNVETPRFQQRVVDAGFFNNWNGLTVKQARKKKVDTVAGATRTSSSVERSVQAALATL